MYEEERSFHNSLCELQARNPMRVFRLYRDLDSNVNKAAHSIWLKHLDLVNVVLE